MKIVAIVGGTGAGKSTVARRLARLAGGAWIDADRVGHRVLRIPRLRRQLLAAFGADMVGPDGEIDRRRLGALVFGDPALLRRLDRVVHPEIARLLRQKLVALERRGVRWVFLDAALFFAFDLGREVDAVLAVLASRAVRRARVLARMGLTPAEVEARLRSQPLVARWVVRADVRLHNDGSRRELQDEVERVWRELRRHRGRHGRHGRT
jgi:dephospho-CoA kinase